MPISSILNLSSQVGMLGKKICNIKNHLAHARCRIGIVGGNIFAVLFQIVNGLDTKSRPLHGLRRNSAVVCE